jgi:hypothetical protein
LELGQAALFLTEDKLRVLALFFFLS